MHTYKARGIIRTFLSYPEKGSQHLFLKHIFVLSFQRLQHLFTDFCPIHTVASASFYIFLSYPYSGFIIFFTYFCPFHTVASASFSHIFVLPIQGLQLLFTDFCPIHTAASASFYIFWTRLWRGQAWATHGLDRR